MFSNNEGMNVKEWANFKIADIFTEVSIAKSLDLLNTEVSAEGINYVGRTRENNGVTAKITGSPDLIDLLNKGNCLTVAMVGDSTCSTFFQQQDFLASQNILILRNNHLNRYNALFIANVIQLEKYRFSYGRTLTKGFFGDHTVKLPSKNQHPNWQLMEDYIKNIESHVRKPSPNPVLRFKKSLTETEWKSFDLSSLFEIVGSVTTPVLELEEYGRGVYPYVTTQATNNGVEGFYDFFSEEGGVLTVDSAVLGYCSYQSERFSASDHVEKLIPKFKLNKYIAMFLVTVINKEQYRYNYGRKCSQDRMRKQDIKLPSRDEQPDWQFMEDYIKSLLYSASL